MADFHLYHHDDLDGVSTGAIMLDFLKSKGDNIISFTPLDYHAKLAESWEGFEFKSPFILVDFQYHPQAGWWIDHHASAFKKTEWQAAYRDDEQHHYDPLSPSACGLAARFLERTHGYKLSPIVHELVRVVDVDDAAGYSTLQEALSLDEPYKKIQLLLGDTEMKKDHEQYMKFREFLVRNLATMRMEDIVAMPEYQDRLKMLREQRLQADIDLQQKAVPRGNVVLVDKGEGHNYASRWACYEKFPDMPYSIQIHNRGGEFKVSIGSNKWSKDQSKVDLGALARNYGGGGHVGVGALFVKTREEAFRIASEIIEYLNKNG